VSTRPSIRTPQSRANHTIGPSTPAGSFNHVIGSQRQGRRERQAEGLGGLEIDDQLELPRLPYRQIARVSALQDLVDIDRGTLRCVCRIRPIRDRPSHACKAREPCIAETRCRAVISTMR
jgi:hypothetical protein